MSITDDLRERVERGVRKILWFDGRDLHLAAEVALDLVMEERRKWGHFAACRCCTSQPGSIPHSEVAYFGAAVHKRCDMDVASHPIVDPRCAPQDERERVGKAGECLGARSTGERTAKATLPSGRNPAATLRQPSEPDPIPVGRQRLDPSGYIMEKPAPPSETQERCPTCNRTRRDGPGQKCLLLPHQFHSTPRKG